MTTGVFGGGKQNTAILEERSQEKLNIAIAEHEAIGFEKWKEQYQISKKGKAYFCQKMVLKGHKPVGF